MPTNIKTYVNKTLQAVASLNSENVGNSFCVPAANTLTTPCQYISWHIDKPLILFTTKGVCRIHDADWKIHGVWDWIPQEIIFLDGSEEGVGGDIQVTIEANGDISMTK